MINIGELQRRPEPFTQRHVLRMIDGVITEAKQSERPTVAVLGSRLFRMTGGDRYAAVFDTAGNPVNVPVDQIQPLAFTVMERYGLVTEDPIVETEELSSGIIREIARYDAGDLSFNRIRHYPKNGPNFTYDVTWHVSKRVAD